MKIKTRSILQELNDIASNRNTEALIESRAVNIIDSAINLIESINKHYESAEADELQRRLINAIKGSDTSKFIRGVRKITEAKRKAKKNEN
jgi:hypothetical protein